MAKVILQPSMTTQPSPTREILKLQLIAIGVFVAIFVVISATLYYQDSRREWILREEQTAHRLELAFETITRDLERVRADVLFSASLESIQSFETDSPEKQESVERQFANLLDIKKSFQQIRLIDLEGREVARVERLGDQTRVVPLDQLQDKSDRYYVRESLKLAAGGVFVSEFDLNQERGKIEEPLNPVIRFVTPVVDGSEEIRFLLVLNYQGATLLNDLSAISLPGKTLLIRGDGEYLLGPHQDDAWGWLLGHQTSFASDFPMTWKQGVENENAMYSVRGEGTFGLRRLSLSKNSEHADNLANADNDLFLVSRFSRENVYSTSKQSLMRLLLFSTALLIPLSFLARLWAVSAVRRKQQNTLIRDSEKKLRELSSRLVRIQEDERRMISREIHDQLGQQATALKLDLSLFQQRIRGTDHSDNEQLSRAIKVSEGLLSSLHDFASRIRPVELDDLGLHDAIESHLSEFESRSGVGFTFEYDANDDDLTSVESENVFRLVQEALNNVLKHAKATSVNVSIKTSKSTAENSLVVQVQDDGIGVSKDTAIEGNSRLGILGMRERTDLLGGKLDVSSQPDLGTCIVATIPLGKIQQ